MDIQLLKNTYWKMCKATRLYECNRATPSSDILAVATRPIVAALVNILLSLSNDVAAIFQRRRRQHSTALCSYRWPKRFDRPVRQGLLLESSCVRIRYPRAARTSFG